PARAGVRRRRAGAHGCRSAPRGGRGRAGPTSARRLPMRPSAPPARPSPPAPGLDLAAVRAEFPALSLRVHGRPLVYLDNAATTQKPRRVIDRLTEYYTRENSNVHRGVHRLSEEATAAYEAARHTAARFLNAADPREIVFVRGTTEAINLVANTFRRARLQRGDEVVVTAMEHHSNIVPWQLACEERGASLRVVPITDEGELVLEQFEAALS